MKKLKCSVTACRYNHKGVCQSQEIGVADTGNRFEIVCPEDASVVDIKRSKIILSPTRRVTNAGSKNNTKQY